MTSLRLDFRLNKITDPLLFCRTNSETCVLCSCCQLLSAIALIKVFDWFNSRYCLNANFTNDPMIDKEQGTNHNRRLKYYKTVFYLTRQVSKNKFLFTMTSYPGQTRTTLGQLCSALWDFQSRPDVIQPEYICLLMNYAIQKNIKTFHPWGR